MSTVDIRPLPIAYREIPARLRPQTPPVFEDADGAPPTAADIELARALVQALDPASRRWYARNHPHLFGE